VAIALGIGLCQLSFEMGKAGVSGPEIARLKKATVTTDWMLATFDGESSHPVPDDSSKVTGFAQPGGAVLNSQVLTLQSLNTSVVSGNLAPILKFQTILVAENVADNGPGDTVNFSAGQGIFLCSETNNLAASVSQDESGEGSP
jgi:hypothetical protein